MSEQREPYNIDEDEQQRTRDRDHNERERQEAIRDTQGGVTEGSEKQTKMEFPHFQDKKLTLFSLEITNDMRRTIGVQFGDFRTSLNAHDALKLLELLQSHKSEIATLSRRLNEAALSDDMQDMQRIKQEWEEYRHEGDETGSM